MIGFVLLCFISLIGNRIMLVLYGWVRFVIIIYFIQRNENICLTALDL